MNQNKQSYQLYIKIKSNITISVGRLGTFDFPAGTYIYTGSAKRNIEARVGRHISNFKKIKWHIDYLLANQHAKIIQIKMSYEDECKLNQKTEGKILIPRFGATDCKNKCGGHLKYIG